MPDFLFIPGDGDEQKFDWCFRKILECYESLTTREVLDSLGGWLDETAKHQALTNRHCEESLEAT